MTVNEFWSWFTANNLKYLFLSDVDSIEKENLLDEFQKHLHEYCDELHFEIGGHPDHDQEVVITAEGKKEYFDAAEELVRRAPSLKNWTFVALKQASGFNHTLEYLGIKYDPSKLWFLPLKSNKNPSGLGIRVGYELFDSGKQDITLWATYLLIHKCIGEKAASLDIQHVEVGALPENPDKNGYIEFVELQKYIDWRKAKTRQ